MPGLLHKIVTIPREVKDYQIIEEQFDDLNLRRKGG